MAEQLRLLGMAAGKRCSRCGEFKERGEFHKEKARKDGLQSWCKVCKISCEIQRHRANPGRTAAIAKRYRQANAEKLAATRKRYRKENHGRILVREAAYRAKTPGRVNAWRAKNPDKVAAQGPAWRAKHPEAAREQHRRRRAREANLPGSYTTDEWLAKCAQYPVCPSCGHVWEKTGKYRLTQDHIIPVTKPGSTDNIENLVPLCFSCNSAKGNRSSVDYS